MWNASVPKIGVNIGRIERGLLVMGCVLDLVRVLASIKRGQVEKTQWHSQFYLQNQGATFSVVFNAFPTWRRYNLSCPPDNLI